MKRIFSITISILIFYSAYSQSLIVTGSNFVTTTDACLQTHSSLTVKNISNDSDEQLLRSMLAGQTNGRANRRIGRRKDRHPNKERRPAHRARAT